MLLESTPDASASVSSEVPDIEMNLLRERSLFMAGVAPKREGFGKQNFE
jgi:hypothetical protein